MRASSPSAAERALLRSSSASAAPRGRLARSQRQPMPALMERSWRGPQTGRPLFSLLPSRWCVVHAHDPMQTAVPQRTAQPALAAGAVAGAATATATATVR